MPRVLDHTTPPLIIPDDTIYQVRVIAWMNTQGIAFNDKKTFNPKIRMMNSPTTMTFTLILFSTLMIIPMIKILNMMIPNTTTYIPMILMILNIVITMVSTTTMWTLQ